MLEAWDGRMRADSRAATLFAVWWRRLPHALFSDELGNDWELGRAVLDQALEYLPVEHTTDNARRLVAQSQPCSPGPP